MQKLALLGGKPVTSQNFLERWHCPKEKQKKILGELIDRDELTGSGTGIGLEFENAFRSYIGSEYCLSFSHGTHALLSAYFAVGIGPGDELITSRNGASYCPVIHLGARPIFVDIDAETLLMDAKEIRKKITSRTRAINITHLNGRICNLDEILDICHHHKIALVEDACHAHGALWDGKKIGNNQHVTCFSMQGFDPYGKGIGGGEGGIATTNRRDYYERMLIYCHCKRKNIKQELASSIYRELDTEVLGLKWRAHPFAMALGLISLQDLDERNEKRQLNYNRTLECLREFEFIKAPSIPKKAKMGGFIEGMRLIFEPEHLGNITSELFIKCLHCEGIPVTGPIHDKAEYRIPHYVKGLDLWGQDRGPLGAAWAGLPRYPTFHPKDFPVSEKMKLQVFILPTFIDVDENYFNALHEAFKKIQNLHRTLITS